MDLLLLGRFLNPGTTENWHIRRALRMPLHMRPVCRIPTAKRVKNLGFLLRFVRLQHVGTKLEVLTRHSTCTKRYFTVFARATIVLSSLRRRVFAALQRQSKWVARMGKRQ